MNKLGSIRCKNLRVSAKPYDTAALIISLALFLMPIKSYAGLFTPNSYEHCVLDKIISAESNVAAVIISKNCNQKKRYSTTKPALYERQLSYTECVDEFVSKAKSDKGASIANMACREITAKKNKPSCREFIQKLRITTPAINQFSNTEIYNFLSKEVAPDTTFIGFQDACLL